MSKKSLPLKVHKPSGSNEIWKVSKQIFLFKLRLNKFSYLKITTLGGGLILLCYELPGLGGGQVLEQQAEDDHVKAASCQWLHRPGLVGKKMADNDSALKMTAWKLPLVSDVTDPATWVKKTK